MSTLPRPARIGAIARRDLAQELKGRRGWVLPAVLAGLLLPLSAAPPALPGSAPPAEGPALAVSGEVPAEVLALPGVAEHQPAQLHFVRQGDDLFVLGFPSDPVRAALDADDPAAVHRHLIRVDRRWPGRTLLLALVATSTLTTAISTSIAGERAHKTLVALLTASVTRLEITLGKWLAWGGLGACATLMAAASALVFGRVEAGWWLLPLPTVPLASVAVGLYMIRNADSVIGGTTVTLRVLPAMLSASGLLAFGLGAFDPRWGALVPVGGALIAAGDTWGDPLTAVLAAGSALGVTALALGVTARDLAEHPPPTEAGSSRTDGLWFTTFVALAHLGLVLGPLAWGMAGNRVLADQLAPADAARASTLALSLLLVLGVSRPGAPARTLNLAVPRFSGPETLGLLSLAAVPALSWHDPWLARTAQQLDVVATPMWAGALLGFGTVSVHELVFRHRLLSQLGPLGSALAWTLVVRPLDPARGFVEGWLLASLAARAGPVPGVVVRVALALLPTAWLGTHPLAWLPALACAAYTGWSAGKSSSASRTPP